MLQLKKSKTTQGYDSFTIITNEGSFDIAFENNLDLYWYFKPKCNVMDSMESYGLIITKEDYEIYREFDILYNSIKNKTPFAGDLFDDKNRSKVVDIDIYTDNNLFINDMVNWHSDDSPYENASYVTIKKENESYIIEFHKSNSEDLVDTFSIRFSNSGSRYRPYNVLFMNMYNNLKNYNFDFHQIHIEEHIYQKKLLKNNKIK